ncbi:MAG: hypothetical protein BWZ10_01906 [candidate division BRC1 bacterium ADurb.BinA364]|nr:MAG: hypothetical protein BWZ10_01906 [candidate division BRC1 bacterium ADurb.BinA364]
MARDPDSAEGGVQPAQFLDLAPDRQRVPGIGKKALAFGNAQFGIEPRMKLALHRRAEAQGAVERQGLVAVGQIVVHIEQHEAAAGGPPQIAQPRQPPVLPDRPDGHDEFGHASGGVVLLDNLKHMLGEQVVEIDFGLDNRHPDRRSLAQPFGRNRKRRPERFIADIHRHFAASLLAFQCIAISHWSGLSRE